MEKIFELSSDFDTPKKLNRSTDIIPASFIAKVEAGEVTVEDIVNIGNKFPVFTYQTCVTVHGDFGSYVPTRVGGYKNLIRNANGSLEIHYSAIDNEAKNELISISRIIYRNREENLAPNAKKFGCSQDSKGFVVNIRYESTEVEEVKTMIGELDKYIRGCWFGYRENGKIVVSLEINYFKNLPLFITNILNIDDETLIKLLTLRREFEEKEEQEYRDRLARYDADKKAKEARQERGKPYLEAAKLKGQQLTKEAASIHNIKEAKAGDKISSKDLLFRVLSRVTEKAKEDGTFDYATTFKYVYYKLNQGGTVTATMPVHKKAKRYESETLLGFAEAYELTETKVEVRGAGFEDIKVGLRVGVNIMKASTNKSKVTTAEVADKGRAKTGSAEVMLIPYKNSLAIYGNTYDVRDKIKTYLNGMFNKYLNIDGKVQAGWIIKPELESKAKEILGL